MRVSAPLPVAVFLLLFSGSIGVRLLPAQTDPSAHDARDFLPGKKDSVKFAVIGDSGTGKTGQYDVALRMEESWSRFAFGFVIMLGDNLYGGEGAKDYRKKFELPYQGLLKNDIRFYASLGNHDEAVQRNYHLFNMGGERYYSFRKGNAQFFALDTDYLDPAQVRWLERELGESRAEWKICFFHHPIYSSGRRHGPDLKLREVLEPIFVQNGVDVVFSGHEHFYERYRPQKGIRYFISGAAGKLRRMNVRVGPNTDAWFDTDLSFMLVEIVGETLYFQAVSRSGQVVDQGAFTSRADGPPGPDGSQSGSPSTRGRLG